MAPDLLKRLPLKTFIALCLLIVGLLPLVSSISVNFPTVARKIEQLSQLERVNELEEKVVLLERAIEHRKANLRTITALPGTAELFSEQGEQPLNPKQINERLGFLFRHWLPADSGVKAIIMVNRE